MRMVVGGLYSNGHDSFPGRVLSTVPTCKDRGITNGRGNGGQNCKDEFDSCNLCADNTHSFGCLAKLSDFAQSGADVTFSNPTDCLPEGTTLLHADEKEGFGSGPSICWDPCFHPNLKGRLIGSNPYRNDSSIVTVAEHLCGAYVTTRRAPCLAHMTWSPFSNVFSFRPPVDVCRATPLTSASDRRAP